MAHLMTATIGVPHDIPNGSFDNWWDRRVVREIHHRASFHLYGCEEPDVIFANLTKQSQHTKGKYGLQRVWTRQVAPHPIGLEASWEDHPNEV